MSTPVSADDSHFTAHVQKYRPRACQGCTGSKLRCVWPSDPNATSCQRCIKSNIPCILREAASRKRRGPSTRIEKLEQKVDGLMTLLKAGKLNGDIPQQSRHGLQEPPTPPFANIAPRPYTSVVVGSENVQTTPELIEIVPGFQLTFEEADRALNIYQSVYTTYFPFVPISVTVTAHEIYDRAPFLLRTILLVTVSQTLAIQKAAQMWFRQQIAQRVVVEQQRHLELLQAILVFVAWGNFQFYIESQATDLLQLAGVIVADLGLDKSPDSPDSSRLSFVPTAIRKVNGFVREGHAPDDRRAMLGCFYLNSAVGALFRRTRSLVYTYTPYLTYCCDKLMEMQEYESDRFLVALVHTQQIITRISDAIPSPELNESLDRSLHMMMATTRTQLDALVQNQPPKVRCNVLLWVHYYGALMKLYEPAIHMGSSSNSNGPLGSIRRTKALCGCLQAARDFFTTYTTIPLDILSSMPLVATAYMSFAVVTSSMILLLDDSDWDISLARKTLDFSAACQTLGERFREGDQVAQSLGRRQKFEDNGKSVLNSYHMKIMWIRQWYISKISTIVPGEIQDAPLLPTNMESADQTVEVNRLQHQSQHQQNTLDEASLLAPMELDEDFWRAILDPEGPNQWTN